MYSCDWYVAKCAIVFFNIFSSQEKCCQVHRTVVAFLSIMSMMSWYCKINVPQFQKVNCIFVVTSTNWLSFILWGLLNLYSTNFELLLESNWILRFLFLFHWIYIRISMLQFVDAWVVCNDFLARIFRGLMVFSFFNEGVYIENTCKIWGLL